LPKDGLDTHQTLTFEDLRLQVGYRHNLIFCEYEMHVKINYLHINFIRKIYKQRYKLWIWKYEIFMF